MIQLWQSFCVVRLLLVSCSLLMGCLPASVSAKDVDFDVLFAKSKAKPVNKTVVVQVSSEDTLVIKSKGPYSLDGLNLLVSATNLRMDVDAEIRAFSVGSKAPAYASPAADGNSPAGAAGENTNGAHAKDGSDGESGRPGAAAGTILLDLKVLSGSGILRVNLSGQAGGDGQQGGRGGVGQQGGKGNDRECGGIGSSGRGANAGGRGGNGGSGGLGGLGGDGGPGGKLRYAASMQSLIDAGRIVFETKGSTGGASGPWGKRGRPGGGGGGGACATCDLQGCVGGGNTGSDGDFGKCGAPLGEAGEPAIAASCRQAPPERGPSGMAGITSAASR